MYTENEYWLFTDRALEYFKNPNDQEAIKSMLLEFKIGKELVQGFKDETEAEVLKLKQELSLKTQHEEDLVNKIKLLESTNQELSKEITYLQEQLFNLRKLQLSRDSLKAESDKRNLSKAQKAKIQITQEWKEKYGDYLRQRLPLTTTELSEKYGLSFRIAMNIKKGTRPTSMHYRLLLVSLAERLRLEDANK